jgi:hypothetical protein
MKLASSGLRTRDDSVDDDRARPGRTYHEQERGENERVLHDASETILVREILQWLDSSSKS